jgi:hypothetical protein
VADAPIGKTSIEACATLEALARTLPLAALDPPPSTTLWPGTCFVLRAQPVTDHDLSGASRVAG